ncbi:MAG: AAA family ATPase [Candidatus Nanoarchaeia archaeon]
MENNRPEKIPINLKKNEKQKNSLKKSLDLSGSVKIIENIKQEVKKAVVGQDKIIDNLLVALLSNGHILIEGVPGLAKTLIIRALASASGCDEKRIQFTVDLLPSDIIGFTTYQPNKGFEIQKGPIFANFIIADEINRSPPKTQSAMLEAMQEKQVTIGKTTFQLPNPFFVMASQNPLENAGVYSLPEAQVDRFLFKIIIDYPTMEEERMIMEKNITLKEFDELGIRPVSSPQEIIELQKVVKDIYMSEDIKKYILKIIEHTRKKDFKSGKFIELGASPRATIAFFIASKANALINKRDYVIPRDVKDVAHNILRHRLMLSYKAGSEGVNSDSVISEILNLVKVP